MRYAVDSVKAKTEEDFLNELEERVRQNRRMAESSRLPKWLQPLAGYWAFHNFKALTITSLIITIGLFWGWFEELIAISKKLFLYP